MKTSAILFVAALAAAPITTLKSTTALASPHMKIVKCEGAKNYHECADITLSGVLELTHADEFTSRIEKIKTANVSLSGPGGSFFAAIIIGEAIFEKKFKTVVQESTICASACAMMWLGGKPATQFANSEIKFHVPYHESNPKNADGLTSVIQGMYLQKIGVSIDQALDMFGHGPGEWATSRYEDGKLKITKDAK